MYVADEGGLNESLIQKAGFYMRSRGHSNASGLKPEGFKILVDSEIVFKNVEIENSALQSVENLADGVKKFEQKTFFVVTVVAIGGVKISKVEKMYEDFKVFVTLMDNNLRQKGTQCPSLEDKIFKNLMPSSDDMFR